MSSTDDVRLRRFFAERIVPAARKLRERGVKFFPLGPDAEEETWYSTAGPVADFSAVDEDSRGEVLRELWESQELPELAGMIGALMDLSDHLEIAEEETPDVSPFVYVMY